MADPHPTSDETPQATRGLRRPAVFGVPLPPRGVCLAMAVVAFAVAAIGAWCFQVEFLRGDSALRRLLQPPAVAEKAGVIHGHATATAFAEGTLPPCVLKYKSGKSLYSVTVDQGARVSFADGRRFVVPKGGSLDFLGALNPRSEAAPDVTRRVAALKGDDIKVQSVWCLAPNEAVYLQGCASARAPGELVPCPGDEYITLVPGRLPGPLIRSRAADAAAWLTLCIGGASVGILLLWLCAAFPWPIVGHLAKHARASARSRATPADEEVAVAAAQWTERRDLFAFVFVGVLIVAAAAIVPLRGGSALYFLPMIGVALALALAGALSWFRFRSVSAALRVVRSMATGRLADQGSELRELAVRVAADAPPTEPLAGSGSPACVRAVVSETVRVKTGKESTTIDQRIGEISHPRWLAVEDASGRAMLEVEPCRLDAIPQPTLFMARSLVLPHWAMEALGKPILPSTHHVQFKVEWMTIDAGQPLVVYGHVGRTTEGDAEARPTGYREAPRKLAVRGETVAYVGDERELARGLATERAAILPLVAALFAAAAATMALCIQAASLT